MAFIRRHRIVLVPLFVTLLAAGATLLLLRGESDEPGGGGPSGPVVTVLPWEELTGLRNDHTREWRVVTQVEYVDPETEELVVEESVSRVREVGSNLCYRDAEGAWQPSVPEWEATDGGFKADRSGYQVYFGATLGAGYAKVVSGKALWMRPHSLVLSDGAHMALVAQIDPGVAGAIGANHPGKLVLANAFGEALDAGLEYVLEKASFHQNVVLRAPIVLPDGFNPATTQLYVFTELGLDNALADGTVSVQYAGERVVPELDGSLTAFSTREPIMFQCTELNEAGWAETRELFAFAPSCAYDSAAGGVHETLAERRLWRDPRDRKTYLVERLPHAWLAGATYPVTLDYTTESGTIDEDETWTAEATYYVSGDINVSGGTAQDPVTLTIEPGTVIKFAEDMAINIGEYGAIVAQGEPYDYIVFTSENDDESGEEIDGSTGEPAAGDYDDAIKIGASASSECAIDYCKIGYASDGIEVDLDIGTIAHCIIRDCGDGIVSTASTATGTPDVFNCLIADISTYGVMIGPYDDTFTLTVTNCTIDGCGGAALHTLSGPTGVANLTAKNNLFTNSTYGVQKAGNGTVTLDYNGWYGNTTDVSGTSKGPHAQDNLPGNPYETDAAIAALGDYFIDLDGNGEDLEDAGSATFSSLYGSGAQFDVGAPEVVDDDIASSEEWSKRSVDLDPVDIGYHHPRIDKIVDNTAINIGSSADPVVFTINAGVVVAFSGSSAKLQFKSDADEDMTLTCDGDADDPIILTGRPLVSMNIEEGYEACTGLYLATPAGSASASVTYARIRGLNRGVQLSNRDSNDEITNCTFQRDYYGLYVVQLLSDRDVSVKNLLFRRCASTACYMNGFGYYPTGFAVASSTFDWCETGLDAVRGYEDTFTISDCLFTHCESGISETGWGAWNEDYNAFWGCDTNVDDESLGAHSLVLTEDPYDPAWFDEDDPASSDWAAQWYLDQGGDCVDGGSRHVVLADLQYHTTILGTETVFDVYTVDIGYHYPTALSVSSSHFDNSPSGSISITYLFGSALTNRKISIYNSDGDLVYQTTQAASDDEISLTWDGKGNQGSYNGQTLDSGAYTVLVTSGAGNDVYAVFQVWIEQSGALTITRPTSNSKVDWY